VWVLFLNSDGTVKSHQKISDTEGGFTGTFGAFAFFGVSVESLGDFDGDGVRDLAVGAPRSGSGTVWMLFLNSDGTVKAHQEISDTAGSFTGTLDNGDSFGGALTSLGDLDSDGVVDLAVGAYQDDDGGVDRGAVWVLFLDGGDSPVPVALQEFDSYWTGNHVVVAWRLLDIGGSLTFDVSRADVSNGSYVHIHGADVVVRRDEFVFEDHDTEPGGTYKYYVVIFEGGRAVASFETEITTPKARLGLEQNHPNPFNPTTTISFVIDREELVSLVIYDVSGRMVRRLVHRKLGAGPHGEVWDGRDSEGRELASGVYFYQLQSGNRTLTRRAVLLK